MEITEKGEILGMDYLTLLKHIKLNVTYQYEFPPEIIKVDGVTIATLGNFSASTGKPKSKKTFNVSAIVAAALSGNEVLKYKAILPPDKNRVLYVDTEQSRCHCHKVLKRILRMAGMSTDEETNLLQFLALREFTPDQRLYIINQALQNEKNLGLVIIDGIRDLMRDINSPSESIDLINELMRWSGFYQLHIHTVLHLNKSDDNTRGHIGTELNNKAETVLQITKNSAIPNQSEVKAMHIRDKEFCPFAFEIGSDSLPYLVEDYSYKLSKKDKNVAYTKLSEEQHRSALEAGFADQEEPLSYKMMLERLKEGYSSIGYDRGRNTLVSLGKFLVSCGALTKSDKGYVYNEDFVFPD